MTQTLQATTITRSTIGLVSIVATAVLTLMALPSMAFAANYAYVNTSNEVAMVVADTWQQAIATAPSIHMHSGVLILNSQADNSIIGDSVSGS